MSHHDAVHHTAGTGLGLVVTWALWLCWAMVVVIALIYWWAFLVAWSIAALAWFGVVKLTGAGVAKAADRRIPERRPL